MTLVHQTGAALLLIILTLCLQCAALALLVHWLKRVVASGIHKLSPLQSAALFMQSTVAVIALHVLQVVLWASGYHWLCLPSWESAFYVSASSYSTAGCGDVVLPLEWRLLGPLEGIIGVLMCGMSASLLFAIVTRLIGEARSTQ
jgi:voltage-gated potassium channel